MGTRGGSPPCQALVQRTLAPFDTAEDRRRKQIIVPIFTVAWPFAFGVWLEDQIDPGESIEYRAPWWGVAVCFWSLTLGLVLAFARRLTLGATSVVCVAISLGFILLDWGNAAVPGTARNWPMIILIMDIFLAISAPRVVQGIVLHGTAAWVVIYHIEDGFRLGLYDVERWTDYPREDRVELCNCAAPPCASGEQMWSFMLLVLLILYADFFATRNFAEGLRCEQAKVLASVEVADQVAASLAGFDLDGADTALADAGAMLPLHLRASYRRLLSNLASYRPYLPQSCFELVAPAGSAGDSSGSGASSATPGIPYRQSVASAAHSTAAATDFTERGRRESHGSSGSVHDTMSSASSLAPGGGAPRRAVPAHVPRHRRVTLLACNSCGFLSAAARCDPAQTGQWLAAAVERFAGAVQSQGGMTDLISADHLSASFGALKAQGTQCAAATAAAWQLAETGPTGSAASGSSSSLALTALKHTAAVCTGRALCGDFGSATAQRFMVIGGVSAFAHAAERCAAAWGVGALLDSGVHADAAQTWSCRLRKHAAFPKVDSRPIGLWEVVGNRMANSAGPDEWMYELESAQPERWEAYSNALARWCNGDVPAALEAIARGAHSCEDAGALQGLLALRSHMRRGLPPPVGDLSAAAFAGDPAPLQPLDGGKDCDAQLMVQVHQTE